MNLKQRNSYPEAVGRQNARGVYELDNVAVSQLLKHKAAKQPLRIA